MTKNQQMEFEKKLQAKTGWGRNEVMDAFKQSVMEVLARLVDAKL